MHYTVWLFKLPELFLQLEMSRIENKVFKYIHLYPSLDSFVVFIQKVKQNLWAKWSWLECVKLIFSKANWLRLTSFIGLVCYSLCCNIGNLG